MFGTRRWDDESGYYRQDWEQRYGKSDRWGEYEPWYRYGWEMRSRPEYQDRDWNTAETDLRRDWESRNPGRRWDEAREHVRGAWEHPRTIQLVQEELVANKQMTEAGRVGIRKDVVTEHKSIEVPVSREEVVIERHPVDRRPSDRPIGEGETIEVPIREEHATAEKRAYVAEEVSVGKRTVQDTERVEGEVRKETLDLDTEGDVDVRR